MNDKEILNYFESQAKSGTWNSLYDSSNPMSYSFIVRFKKGIELIHSIEGKKILDLGCGTGILIPHIVENNGNYIGLDNSENMLESIRKQYKQLVDSNKIKLVSKDIRDFDSTDKVDVMIGLGFIEYFDNPEVIIKKLHDLLEANGQLILSFPNFNSLDYFSLKLFSPIRGLIRLLTGKSTHQPPRKMWDTKFAKKLFTDAGFKNIKVVNYNINLFAYPFTKISMKFSNFWAKRFENSWLSKNSFFASGFLVSADK